MTNKTNASLVVLILVLATSIVAAPQKVRVVNTEGENAGQVVTTDNLFVESTDGVVNAPVSVETARLDGEDATAGDTAGSDLLIAAGQGTGTADSGDIEFEVAITDEGTSTTLKTREAVARFEGLTGWLSLLKPLELLEEASTPATNPSTDSWLVYFQSDGLYYLDDAGAETGPLISASSVVTDHGAMTGLSDDDHTQYPLLAGRSGGQTLIGGTGSGDNLVLDSTSNATQGHVIIQDGRISSADATHTGTELFGLNAVASGNDAVAIGQGANVGPNGVVIGSGSAGGDGAVIIGQGNNLSGAQDAVVIGLTATGTDGSIALGLTADATGGNVAIGSGATADGVGAIALGGSADAGHRGSISIATDEAASTTADNQMVIKGISSVYIGDGVTDTSPVPMAVYATGGSGANVAGADLTIGGGASTGDAAGGRIFLSVTPAGATGSSANPYAAGLEIEGDGDTRVHEDLIIDGATTAYGMIDAVTGVEIDSASKITFDNGAHAIEAYPSGTELLVDSTGATLNSVGINDLDVVVKTGNISVTAGAYQTNGTTRISNSGAATLTSATVTGDVDLSSAAYDLLLYQAATGGAVVFDANDDSDTLLRSEGTDAVSFRVNNASISRYTQFYIRNETGSTQMQWMSGSASTPGYSFNGDTNNGWYRSGADTQAWTTNGTRAGGISSVQKWDMVGGATIGNGSNTRWFTTDIASASGTAATFGVGTSAAQWTIAPISAGDIWITFPSVGLNTEVAGARVYYQTTGYAGSGSTLNIRIYEWGAGTMTALGTTASQPITSDTTGTLTQSLSPSAALAAGEQYYVRVWMSPATGNVTTYIRSVEVQFEEREY